MRAIRHRSTAPAALAVTALLVLAGHTVSVSTAGEVLRPTDRPRPRLEDAPEPGPNQPGTNQPDPAAITDPPVTGPAAAAGPLPGPAADLTALPRVAVTPLPARPRPAPSTAVVHPWLAPSFPLPDPDTAPDLEEGDRGEPVRILQQRLSELGYRPGDIDGRFEADTWSAVLAFQKSENLARTGQVDRAVWTRLAAPRPWRPSNSTAYPRVEVDLERQVVLVVFGPLHVVTLNTSTGGGYGYRNSYGGWEVAETPPGVYQVYRTYDGYETAPLGSLYRPMYFFQGYALHGSPYVPDHPDSHGCVRLSNDDMDWLWDQHTDALPVMIHETMDPTRFYPGSGAHGAPAPDVVARTTPAVPVDVL